jgi:hypothetical protein
MSRQVSSLSPDWKRRTRSEATFSAWLDMALLAKPVENRLQAFQVTRIKGWVEIETINHLGLPQAEILNDKKGDGGAPAPHAKMTPPNALSSKKLSPECESARGLGADQHNKPLKSQWWVGSRRGADSHPALGTHFNLPRHWHPAAERGGAVCI